MTAFAERFRNEGLEQGLEQGREQGRQQGLEKGEVSAGQKILFNLLCLKFSDEDITQDIRGKIERADYETLLRWSSNVLSATSIEEIFN